jgi:hypothetical protein
VERSFGSRGTFPKTESTNVYLRKYKSLIGNRGYIGKSENSSGCDDKDKGIFN